jgi:hypothetical protein
MKKLFLCTSLLFLLASACGSSPVDTVKNGVLDFDKSATIGDVFKGYKYFTNGEWKIIHDQQNRTIVQFSGILQLDEKFWHAVAVINYRDRYLSLEEAENTLQKMINKIIYIAQFTIDKDNYSKFKLSYSGLMVVGYNNEEKDFKDNELIFLQEIYKNNDDILRHLSFAFMDINSPNYFEKK